jgi:hypothetical protein
MSVFEHQVGERTSLRELIAAGLRENNHDLIQAEPIAAFLRQPEFELESPVFMAKVVAVARQVMRCPQEIKSLRGWLCMSRFAMAALDLNDRYTLNMLAHCAEMGIAHSEREKLTQIMLMCLGNRALPEQVQAWSESCFDVEPWSSLVGLYRAAHIAHQNRDKDALKGILWLSEKLVSNVPVTPADVADEYFENDLVAARYDDLCGKLSVEVLCEKAMQVNPILREKYCREICTAFPQHTSPQKCAICAKRYSGCVIIRE